MSKRRRLRMRRLKRGRIRRFNAFRRKLIRSEYPVFRYCFSYAPYTVDWDYNKQAVKCIDLGVYAAVRSALLTGIELDPTKRQDWLLSNVGFQASITNQSPSTTYVQVFWMKVIEDTQTSLATFFTNEATANYGGGAFPAVTDYLNNPIASYQAYRVAYRPVKKQFFEMEGGGVVKFGFKPKHKKIIRETYMNSFGASSYRAGVTWVLVVRAWSQLIQNSDDALFIRDNGPIGVEVREEYRASRWLQSVARARKISNTLNAASGPLTMTDVGLSTS